MKILTIVGSLFLLASATNVFAAERVAFHGTECGGGNTSWRNGDITCPVALTYSWGARIITKVRIDLSNKGTTTCRIYATSPSGQVSWRAVNYNAGDVVVNLTVPANNYVNLRCSNTNNIPEQAGGGSTSIIGYIVESN